MEKILKLFNRIDIHLQSKNTQEIILDLGDSDKARERMEQTNLKLQEELKELQEWLDDPASAEYISENLDVFTETFDSVFFATNICTKKLLENAEGKEELKEHLLKIMSQRAANEPCPCEKKSEE